MGQKFFDKYSKFHFLSGMIIRFTGINLYSWILIHILFEILENSEKGMYIINKYLTFWIGGKPSRDTILNSTSDTLFAILGWILIHVSLGKNNFKEIFINNKNNVI